MAWIIAALMGIPPAHAYLMWQAQQDGKSVFVLAVPPLTSKVTDRLSPDILNAYDMADLVAFESQPEPARKKTERRKIIDNALYPEGDNLMNYLSADVAKRFEATCRDLNIQNRNLMRVRPWAAAHNLMNIASSHAGVLHDENLELYFQQKALRDQKSTDTLNKAEEVIATYGAMSRAEHIKILDKTLKEIGDLSHRVQQVEAAWTAYDADAAAKLVNQSFAGYEDIQRALFDETNRRWARKIHGMIRFDDKIFVAVPLPHTVGSYNLLDHLREAGFSVAQVKPETP